MLLGTGLDLGCPQDRLVIRVKRGLSDGGVSSDLHALAHQVQLAFAHSTRDVFYAMAAVLSATFVVCVWGLPRNRGWRRGGARAPDAEGDASEHRDDREEVGGDGDVAERDPADRPPLRTFVFDKPTATMAGVASVGELLAVRIMRFTPPRGPKTHASARHWAGNRPNPDLLRLQVAWPRRRLDGSVFHMPRVASQR